MGTEGTGLQSAPPCNVCSSKASTLGRLLILRFCRTLQRNGSPLGRLDMLALWKPRLCSICIPILSEIYLGLMRMTLKYFRIHRYLEPIRLSGIGDLKSLLLLGS